MKVYYASDLNWIEITDGKITDLAVGNNYVGCRCSSRKEKVGECESFKRCLITVINQMDDKTKEKVKRYC